MNERVFLLTMSAAKKMLREGIITPDEYREFETNMIQKYKPKFGDLFSNINLICLETRGNM